MSDIDIVAPDPREFTTRARWLGAALQAFAEGPSEGSKAAGLSGNAFHYILRDPERAPKLLTIERTATHFRVETAGVAALEPVVLLEKPPLPYCGCGCGHRVRTLDAKFLYGHYQRTPEWRLAEAERKGRRPLRTCANPYCGERFRALPGQKTHSRACKSIAAHARLSKTPLPLQTTLLQHLTHMQRSVAAFARSIGVTPGSLTHWFRKPTSTIRRTTLEAIAREVGMSVEQAIDEAGGITDDERRAELARTGPLSNNVIVKGTDHAHQLAVLGGSAGKGKPKSDEHIGKVRDAMTNGGNVKKREALKRWAEKEKSRAELALKSYLRWHPSPSWNDVLEHAKVVARRLGWSTLGVLEVWKSQLQSLRVWRDMGGRPRHEDVCAVVRRELDGGAQWKGIVAAVLGDTAVDKNYRERLSRLNIGVAAERLRVFWAKHQCPAKAAFLERRAANSARP